MTRRSTLFGASAVLVGTAIGAGVFGVPFVIAQSGTLVGVIHIVLLGCVVLLTLLAYGDVVMRTSGVHQFVGYAQRYLGNTWRIIAFFSLVFGMYAALTAYILEIGHFFEFIFASTIGGSSTLYSFLFWLIASAAVVSGVSLIVRLELWLVIGMTAIVLLLGVIGIPQMQIEYLTYTNSSQALLPYGVVLFAFGAASSIPEIRRMLAKQRRLDLLPKAVWVGIGFTAMMYALFALIIVGISGPDTSESAVEGIAAVFGEWALVIGSVFGILAMGSSFLVVGLALKQMYQYDFQRSRIIAVVLTLGVPYILYLFNLATFIQLLAIAGAVTGGLQGIIIWRMYMKARRLKPDRTPEFRLRIPAVIVYGIQALYLAGIAYEVIGLAF